MTPLDELLDSPVGDYPGESTAEPHWLRPLILLGCLGSLALLVLGVIAAAYGLARLATAVAP